ncbi:MAG: hypothetical protein ABL940_00940 [Bacteroidia bacterium]
MKLFTLLFALTFSMRTFGQQLMYKGELVDTVKIISNSSYYHFDTCGTTTGVYDEYIIVFKLDKNIYILKPYQRTKYKFTFEPETSFRTKKVIKDGTIVKQNLISDLLKELEITSIKPNFNNIGITSEYFLKLTDKKHIIKVAKQHNTDWHFKKAYSTKHQNKKIFNECQNINTLNMYLSTAFDTTGYTIITDVNDHFDIIISTVKTNYRFEGKYPNSFKQPWYYYSGNGAFGVTSVLNFAINSTLVKILPSNFSSLETLKIEALTNKYIEWYLEKCNIIF